MRLILRKSDIILRMSLILRKSDIILRMRLILRKSENHSQNEDSFWYQMISPNIIAQKCQKAKKVIFNRFRLSLSDTDIFGNI